MRHLIEDEVVGGAAASQNDLAFIDRHVPDRMLFSPAVSRNLTQPLSQHLAAADRGAFPYWTLQDIIRASTAEELADAEAFARCAPFHAFALCASVKRPVLQCHASCLVVGCRCVGDFRAQMVPWSHTFVLMS